MMISTMISIAMQTVKEVGLAKQDLIPAMGLGFIWGFNSEEWQIICSLFIAGSIVGWKLVQIYILLSKNRRDNKRRDRRTDDT